MALLELCQGKRPYFGSRFGNDPAEEVHRVIEGEDLARLLGVIGAARAEVDGTTTRIVVSHGKTKLVLSELRLQRGSKMPLRVWARNLQLEEESGWIHIGQRSAGKRIGGVSLEIKQQLPELRTYDVRRHGDQVVVTPRA